MRQHVINELNNLKVGHSKVNCIVHSDLKSPQKYLTSSILSNEQKSLLFNLRCKSQNQFLSNFSSSTVIIPCKICQEYEDTQEHALICEELREYLSLNNIHLSEDIHYSDLFGCVYDQLRITEAFQVIIDAREKLHESTQGLPGHCSGPRDL